MRCINKKKTLISILLIAVMLLSCSCTQDNSIALMSDYEVSNFNTDLYTTTYFADSLAVTSVDTSIVSYTAENVYGAGLFGVDSEEVYYGYNLFEKLYPASTTKILTAYVALKYGNLDDVITVTEEDIDLPWDSSVCGLEVGDQLTLYDLLVGLLLKSGNDNAMAIANYISGDIDTFAALMTSEAAALGATGSNFVNPHGLHDENHYTTVYDLYLIFNACIKNEDFVEIISIKSYDTVITGATGEERSVTWSPTNAYAVGTQETPDNVDLIGGKTGYTSNARSCLVLLEEDSNGEQYISVVLGAESLNTLYTQMTELIESLETTE